MIKYLSDNEVNIIQFLVQILDDDAKYPDVDISNINFKPVSNLVTKFNNSNIPLIVKDITSPIGIPTFNASSIEWITENYGYLVRTWNSSRCKNCIIESNYRSFSDTSCKYSRCKGQSTKNLIRKWNHDEKKTWQFMKSKNSVKFSEIKSYVNDDILDDINLILSRLNSNGLNQVIVVNTTNPQIIIPVVRTIVSGLETFKITKAVIGKRGRESFKT